MKKRIMVDIEKLGNTPEGVIISIGWVQFSLDRGPNIDTAREVRLDMSAQLEAGLKVEGRTLEFWLQQVAPPWAEDTKLFQPAHGIREFLNDVRRADEVWAKSPAYDLVSIKWVAEKFGIPSGFMWNHRSERCFRTLRNLAPSALHVPPLGIESKHGALADAVHQATECASILDALGDAWG